MVKHNDRIYNAHDHRVIGLIKTSGCVIASSDKMLLAHLKNVESIQCLHEKSVCSSDSGNVMQGQEILENFVKP